MAISGSVNAVIRATTAKEDTVVSSWADAATITINKRLNFEDGTTAGKADLAFFDERTVATASNDDLDLAGGLTDVYGNTITFAEIVGFFVLNEALDGTANTTNLTIGAGTNAWTTWFAAGTTKTVGPLLPGTLFALFSPDASGLGAVTAGTGDILRIANSSGASATYVIGILGRSA